MTVTDLIERFILKTRQPGARQLGASHEYTLRRLQRSKLGAMRFDKLKPQDFIDYCTARKAGGVQSATVLQDMTFLTGVLKYAAEIWEMSDAGLVAYKKAKPQLVKEQLIAKSQPRDRRPNDDELERLLALAEEEDARKRNEIRMVPIIKFQIPSARRISETCRLRVKDVNVEKRTCMVYDLKNPKGKGFHDEFPLLGDAWTIVQERLSVIGDKPEARLFPYNHKSISARFTLMKKKLGIVGLHLHDLRREGISRLFELGLNVPQVSKVSLHRNPAVLLRTYTTLRAEDVHGVVAEKQQAST